MVMSHGLPRWNFLMRFATWNCSMALHRKFDAMLGLQPDIAVICECAEPQRWQARAGSAGIGAETVWVGDNCNKGLAVLAFNGYRVSLAQPFHARLRHLAPIRVSGPSEFNLLAVWAQNGSGGVSRKHQLGPLRRALTKYRSFLAERPSIVAGDFNNSVYWHRPGWRINHANAVATLKELGLASAYHALRGEPQGRESVPTIYWRDRRKDGPTYHIDYVFLPARWLVHVRELAVGTFEEWCGAGLSDHVPIVVDVEL
jgi:exodeoxyribonuclease-3